MTCANCGLKIDPKVGIVKLSMTSPRHNIIAYFCTGLCLAPWLTKINDGTMAWLTLRSETL